MKTDTPLADVALACGFTDQSDFTRVFSAATGLPSGAWRRATGNAGSLAIFSRRPTDVGQGGEAAHQGPFGLRAGGEVDVANEACAPISARISVEVVHESAVRLQTLNHNEPTEPDPQESPHVRCGIWQAPQALSGC
jgi:hypothetical protein